MAWTRMSETHGDDEDASPEYLLRRTEMVGHRCIVMVHERIGKRVREVRHVK